MRVRLVLALTVVLLVACVTINVYFPEAAVKDLSQQIEKEVQKKAAQDAQSGGQPAPQPPSPAPAEQPREKGPSAGLLDELLGGVAYAQAVPAPEVTNPAIRRIIDSRAARVAALDKYKVQGAIGENNRALVEARNLEALTDLKARAEVQKLVRDENQDREELFREIAVAKKVDMSQLDKIRETYAGTLRDNARPGDWIQAPNGTWKQKS